MLSQALVNVGIGVYFNLNKAYITQKLCENRNNPSAHCDGHCYLSKQLKKAEEGETKNQSQTLKEKEEVVISLDEHLLISFIPTYTETGYTHSYITSVPDAPYREIQQPPKIVA